MKGIGIVCTVLVCILAGVLGNAAAAREGPSSSPVQPVATIFEENFDTYADGEHPSSIVEVHERQIDYGEVIGGRYAAEGGNRHLLVAPKVRDFDLGFTMEPHPRAAEAPMLVVEFRTDPKRSRGYSLTHWMTPEWHRLDLNVFDRTTSPPVSQRLSSSPVSRISLPPSAPIRFSLSVRDQRIVVRRNDEVLLDFVNTDKTARVDAPGNIVLAAYLESWRPGAVAPLYFDEIRLETPERKEAGRSVFHRGFDASAGMRGAHFPLTHDVEITEILDTGLDTLRTDAPGGRVYRVVAKVDFPQMFEKFRSMAAHTPYMRLERPDGSTLLEQPIFRGILGNWRPGTGTPHGGGAPQLLRLMTEYDAPPHYGVFFRNQPAADGTGPQSSVRYLMDLPNDFNVAVGWKSFMDNDHLAVSGPVEGIYRKDGTPLYRGAPLRQGDRALTVRSPVPAGLVARVSPKTPDYARFLDRFKENHYFLEGEPVRFAVFMAAGPGTIAAPTLQWRLLDAYRRPLASGEETFASDSTDQAKTLRGIGRRVVSTYLPLSVKAPGVYWLDLDADGVQLKRAFSIVPAEQRPGNTAARASGLPWIQGPFNPWGGWNKDAEHYVSESSDRGGGWGELLQAFNMKIHGPPPGVTIPKTEAAFVPGPRLWWQDGFTTEAVQAFLASKEYRPRPEDAPLRDPQASAEVRKKIIMGSHAKEWIDHWCTVFAANEAAARATWDKHAPGCEYNGGYYPGLINSFYYGNLYACRLYGGDARLIAAGRRLPDIIMMETYAEDFGREPASYTPSIAQTKMAFPTLGLGWELYGAGGYVDDYRTFEGRPPHGLHYPSRHAMAHQVAEWSMAPWYFDGKSLHPAGNTHLRPQMGDWTQEMLLGAIDGLRAAADVKNLVPMRGPAFVSSWAAADLDPAWEPGRWALNNSAAEAPAYAYLQSRLAGLAGGFFLDIDDVGKLDRSRADVLVLPSMRGATREQTAAIRRLYENGVALVCFDDAAGLEDLFGIRLLTAGIATEYVERARGDKVLTGLDRDTLAERVAFSGTVRYGLAGAVEVLSATDGEYRRVAPMLTLHRPANKPGAVFFAAGATEVGRRYASTHGLTYEGEVLSKLVQQSLRRALVAVADPVVQVSPPGTALAFGRPEGGLFVVVMEGSAPFGNGEPVEVELSLRGAGAEEARLACEKPLTEVSRGPDGRRVRLTLEPDEVVTIDVTGMNAIR